eukprot:CAMPEP_0167744234 /NCGR_PEP_ID=MMETSP0110_2-20121227/2475_1 /TAXON_ID=629695 /ORGANISM="Gymnochlora sp., Strain CCMP2014" /LENGTH=284 /DNA_ID=CAMNT_0007628727 /DNA_START=40 /DNA_END=894 /DNA_ORIENTATION=+
MTARHLVVSNVYISAHSISLLNALKARVHPDAYVVSTFADVQYNRASICITGPPNAVEDSVLSVVKTAFDEVDYSKHAGSHPAIGAVDHVNVHPLQPSKDMKVAGKTAKSIASRLAKELTVPVFTYGEAHPEGQSLAKGRKALGYFVSHKQDVLKEEKELKISPCYGPKKVNPKKGVTMVGACPHVVNFNIPIEAKSLAEAREICDRIRGSKGGLKGVQAMALKNKNGIEIACNLLDVSINGPEEVERVLLDACVPRGITLGKSYIIGQLPSAVLEKTLNALGR